MKRDRKPGELAMVSAPGLDEKPMTWATRCYAPKHPDEPHWHVADRPTYLPARAYGITVRPLVVIDPEDLEQVGRLTDAYHRQRESMTNVLSRAEDMQAALREFADPKPPKPDQPAGQGAVIEDRSGDRWVSCGDNKYAMWVNCNTPADITETRRYEDIDAVRVLSEGVQS